MNHSTCGWYRSRIKWKSPSPYMLGKPICNAGRRLRIRTFAAQNNSGLETYDGPQQERQILFDRIAHIYDQLNSDLSFGQHWVWKRMAVKWAGAREGDRGLDVCCGTGDLAGLLAKTVGPTGQVVAVDFSEQMLAYGQRRTEDLPPVVAGKQAPIQWMQGDALQLPLTSDSFDCATIGYGLRNVGSIASCLGEIARVLKPGAKVACLDFNNTDAPLADAFQAAFLRNVVVPTARRFDMGPEYEYIRPSIKNFPTGKSQEQLALQAGFSQASHFEIMGGLMGILVATK